MIEFTIKTLDSINHTLRVDDDITVQGLKQKIFEELGIEINQQRLIFFGRVLHDYKKLSEYEVHGKVIHLVERPPPRFHRLRQPHQTHNQHQRAAEEEMTRRLTEDQNHLTGEHESPTTLARIEFLERCIEDVKGLFDLLHRPDVWIPQIDSQCTTPELERFDGAGIYDPSMSQHLKRRAKRARSAHSRLASGESPQPGPSHADSDSPQSPTNDGSSDSGFNLGASATTNIFTDRLGRVFEPRLPLPPAQHYSNLMAEMVVLEQQLSECRRKFVRWMRSRAGNEPLPLEEAEVSRRQQFSNLMNELHHTFAHMYHVTSDLNVVVTPTTLRVTSDPTMISPIQVQVGSIVLASDGQGNLLGHQQPGQMAGSQQGGEMPPLQAGQRARGTLQQFPAAAEIIMHQVIPGVQAPMMISAPATALNINMQPNPVTFQLEIETRSLETALLNTVTQFIANNPEAGELFTMDHNVGDVIATATAASTNNTANNTADNKTAANNAAGNSAANTTVKKTAADNTTATNNTAASNSAADNSAANNTAAANPADNNTAAGNTVANNTAAGNAADNNSAAGNTADNTAAGNTADNNAAAGKTADNKAAAGKTADNNAAASKTANKAAAGNPSANNTAAAAAGDETETESIFATNPAAVSAAARIAAVVAAATNATITSADNTGPRPTPGNNRTATVTHITPPIVGVNLGTSWHLGTFDLSTIHSGGMEVDGQTDGEGTEQNANRPSNNQASRQMLYDFENLFRGLSQAHGLGDMEIVMMEGQEEASGGAQAQSPAKPPAPAKKDTQKRSNTDHDGAQTSGSGQSQSDGRPENSKSEPGKSSENRPPKELPVNRPKAKAETRLSDDAAVAEAAAEIEEMLQERIRAGVRPLPPLPQVEQDDTMDFDSVMELFRDESIARLRRIWNPSVGGPPIEKPHYEIAKAVSENFEANIRELEHEAVLANAELKRIKKAYGPCPTKDQKRDIEAAKDTAALAHGAAKSQYNIARILRADVETIRHAYYPAVAAHNTRLINPQIFDVLIPNNIAKRGGTIPEGRRPAAQAASAAQAAPKPNNRAQDTDKSAPKVKTTPEPNKKAQETGKSKPTGETAPKPNNATKRAGQSAPMVETVSSTEHVLAIYIRNNPRQARPAATATGSGAAARGAPAENKSEKKSEKKKIEKPKVAANVVAWAAGRDTAAVGTPAAAEAAAASSVAAAGTAAADSVAAEAAAADSVAAGAAAADSVAAEVAAADSVAAGVAAAGSVAAGAAASVAAGAAAADSVAVQDAAADSVATEAAAVETAAAGAAAAPDGTESVSRDSSNIREAPNQLDNPRTPRRSGVRNRMRAPTIPISHGIYDRFLVCNSSLARRQLNRRRQAAEAARQQQEKRALQERARREDRESRDAPQNQSAVHSLMRIIRRQNTFGETWVVGLVVTLHEATTPEVYMVLTEAEIEALRAALVSCLRPLKYVCAFRGGVTPNAIAGLILGHFEPFIDNMHSIASIRPNVSEMASIRSVFNMYMPALWAVLERQGSGLCVASYRQLFASFFYDIACLIVHICRDGYRGFKAIFHSFIEKIAEEITTEQTRDQIRMLSVSLEARVADHIETNPSNPHQFVVRTDGVSQCICYDEAERSSRAVSQQSEVSEPAQPEIEPPGEYPMENVNSLMRMAGLLSFDEEIAAALMLCICESITTEPSVLWDEDYSILRRMLSEYLQQFTRTFNVREEGMVDRTTAGVIDHLSYYARRIVNSPRLRHNTNLRASLHAAISHYMPDIVGLLVDDYVFIKNFRGIISEMYCTVLTILSTTTYDGIFGLKLIMKEFINDILATVDSEKVREYIKNIGDYLVSQGIHTIQTRPVEFLQFLVTDCDQNFSMMEPQPSTSGMSSVAGEDRASMTARRSMAEAIERSSFAVAGRSEHAAFPVPAPSALSQPMFAAPDSTSSFAHRPFSTSESSSFVVPQRQPSMAPEPPLSAPQGPGSIAPDRPAISVKRLSTLTGEQPSSTLTVETPQLLSEDMLAAVAARLQGASGQTSMTLAGGPVEPMQHSGSGERHQSKAEKRSSSGASPSASKSTPTKSKIKHSSGPKRTTAEMMDFSSDQMMQQMQQIQPPIAEETPMAGLERFQNFQNPFYPLRHPMEGQPQACYGCLNPALMAENYSPAPAPMFALAKALTPKGRATRPTPSSTVTSGSLAAQGSSSATPNLVAESPERSPQRVSSSSPVNKRMKQEREAGENNNPQSTEGAEPASASDSNDDACENRRKYPTYRSDRDSHDDESPKEDSSESKSQSRVGGWMEEGEWERVMDADAQVAPQPQPPFSDAYLTGMSARRRRRVRQARPPQEAGAFLHDCLSTASEQAIEGGDAERSVFGAFYNTFRNYAATRVNASNDFRPALHAAVHKMLSESSSHKDRSETPERQQSNNNNNT